MGVDSWGASPLYVNPVNVFKALAKVLADGKGIFVSFSRKGPWKGARTLATQTGMTNQWLKDQGLLNVKEL
jgi:hypothetical protein